MVCRIKCEVLQSFNYFIIIHRVVEKQEIVFLRMMKKLTFC